MRGLVFVEFQAVSFFRAALFCICIWRKAVCILLFSQKRNLLGISAMNLYQSPKFWTKVSTKIRLFFADKSFGKRGRIECFFECKFFHIDAHFEQEFLRRLIADARMYSLKVIESNKSVQGILQFFKRLKFVSLANDAFLNAVV